MFTFSVQLDPHTLANFSFGANPPICLTIGSINPLSPPSTELHNPSGVAVICRVPIEMTRNRIGHFLTKTNLQVSH